MVAAHLLWIGDFDFADAATWVAVVDGRSSILFATLAGVSIGLVTGARDRCRRPRCASPEAASPSAPAAVAHRHLPDRDGRPGLRDPPGIRHPVPARAAARLARPGRSSSSRRALAVDAVDPAAAGRPPVLVDAVRTPAGRGDRLALPVPGLDRLRVAGLGGRAGGDPPHPRVQLWMLAARVRAGDLGLRPGRRTGADAAPSAPRSGRRYGPPSRIPAACWR